MCEKPKIDISDQTLTVRNILVASTLFYSAMLDSFKLLCDPPFVFS